jgi:hypothetical protein
LETGKIYLPAGIVKKHVETLEGKREGGEKKNRGRVTKNL